MIMGRKVTIIDYGQSSFSLRHPDGREEDIMICGLIVNENLYRKYLTDNRSTTTRYDAIGGSSTSLGAIRDIIEANGAKYIRA